MDRITGRQDNHETFERVLERRVARRKFIMSSMGALPVLAAAGLLLKPSAAKAAPVDGLNFSPISLMTNDQVTVPAGYSSQVLISWGDPVLPGAPAFNNATITPEIQRQQFGFNSDFLGYFPFPNNPFSTPGYGGGQSSRWGLLTVNHEYTDGRLMFPGYDSNSPTFNEVNTEIAAHGLSIVLVYRIYDEWRYWSGSSFNRRIHGETEMAITGPAAGDSLLQVSYDSTGTAVRGMLNNCGGGKTPWGTLLTCEENFNQYFANASQLDPDSATAKSHARYGLTSGESRRKWERFHNRFDLSKDPNEPFRFGYVVEIDPYDPSYKPKKRTALGRMKHEAAVTTIAPGGQAIVYMGDDQRFDYMYKFVSQGTFNRSDRSQNMDLLDSGTLYVAKFNDDGSGDWIPLIAGQGALSEWTPAQVSIKTREAADLVGATAMDRPEDVEVSPTTGKIYAAMTNNSRRTAEQVNAANPRAGNSFGHIIEITETNDNHAGDSFNWEIFMLCGDPAVVDAGTFFAGFDPSAVSPIANPDNLLFDSVGNLWIATDGQPRTLNGNDGIYACPVFGPDRGFVRQFLSGVIGSEVASLEMTPDDGTLFAAIQHPGEGSTILEPTSRWPDFSLNPPRPGVVATVKTGRGGRYIGS